MKLLLFAIMDAKLEEFGQPFTSPTLAAAERAFTDMLRDPRSEINRHPDDYDLYAIGHYDTSNGGIQQAKDGIFAKKIIIQKVASGTNLKE